MTGRPIRGLIGGFLLGIFVDVDLVFGGVVKLESVVLTILPIALPDATTRAASANRSSGNSCITCGFKAPAE